MALPKRKHCSTRRDKRRSHWNLATASLTKCPQCGKAIVPHRICGFCGFYRGRAVLVVADKKKKTDER